MLAPVALHANDFDYTARWKSLFIVGIVENQYSFTCGAATKKHLTDPGYISLYQHDYWLEGVPHKAWNFDVQTGFPETTAVWVDIYLDGHFFTQYTQQMKVDTQSVSSTSDTCDDHLGGFCPERASVKVLDDLIGRLGNAKVLSFHLFDGKTSEIHDLDVSDFSDMHLAIDACLGRLAIRVPKN